MVQRLNAEQAKQIAIDCAPDYADLRYPEPVSVGALSDFLEQMAGAYSGRCYGLFNDQLEPKGIFAGVLIIDPVTGVKMGLEQIWWSAPGTDGRVLLAAFEDDCRKENCGRVVSGYAACVNPRAMARLYRGLGYSEYSTSVVKEL
jgi:hypothetical protein